MKLKLTLIAVLFSAAISFADDGVDPALLDFLKARAAARVAAPQQDIKPDQGVLDAIRKSAAARATPTAPSTYTVRTKQAAQGWHIHQCTQCGHQWSHNDNNVGNAAAHMCPIDGSGPYWMPVQRNVRFVDTVVPNPAATQATPPAPVTTVSPTKISYLPSFQTILNRPDCPTGT